jgi:chromosome partitioning protein
LLIDLDPQANLSQSLGLINQEKTIYGALKGIQIAACFSSERFDVIPSLDLSRNRVEF